MRISIGAVAAFIAALHNIPKQAVPPALQTAESREFLRARAQAKRERKAAIRRRLAESGAIGRVEK